MKNKSKFSMKNRFEKSIEEAKRGSGGAGTVFDWGKLKDTKVQFYDTKKYGRHKIIILPYLIKTKNHPLVHTGDAKVGEPDYFFEYWDHRGIGPTQQRVVCINKMYGKTCPICEMRQEFFDKGKKQEAGKLKPQQHAIYNMYDANDSDAGLQVLDVSYSNFQKPLVREATDYNEDGSYVIPGDLDDLKVIKFKSYEDSFVNPDGGKSAKFANYESFSFDKAEIKIDDSIFDETISFDALIKIPTKEEIEKILYGNDEDSSEDSNDDEDEKPKNKKSKPSKDEDEDEDSDNEDEDEEEDNSEEDEEDEDSDNDDEEEDSEEDSEDDEEEEDKPPPKPKAKTTSSIKKCPKKHTFGTDCDKFKKDCDKCDDWDECVKEQNRLKKQKK